MEQLLDVQGLKKYFPITKGFMGKVRGHVKAVDDVSLNVVKGETLGLVGESGCGKSTLGRTVARAYEPTEGKILFTMSNGETQDIALFSAKELKNLRKEIQMIFQDPYSSLDPRMTVKNIVGEPLKSNKMAKGSELEDRVKTLLEYVGLETRHLNRFPHAFSGGQRQRLGIARALALNPRLILADEPVSALDVSIQAQILNLLQELQKEFDLTYIFVAHDLSVIRHISDRVAVMYVGKIVEQAETEVLFDHPLHPYTEALLSASPEPDPEHKMERIILSGEVANPADPPPGCLFHPRCRYVKDMCRIEAPLWEEAEEEHFVRCHRAKELSLRGS